MDPSPIDFDQPGHVLTVEQRRFYDKNGYLIIRNCLPRHEIERYVKRFYEICEGKDVPISMTVARDVSNPKLSSISAERSVSKLRDFNHDKVLFDYCKHPLVVDVVKDLISFHPSDSIMSMHGMLINKPPDTGNLASRHPMHQDLAYFPFRPADYIVGAWTAMEKITRLNGCLEVVPGSHRTTGCLKVHGYPKWTKGVNPAYYGVVDFRPEDAELVHLEMDIGDTVFFHPLLLHGSGANRTDGFRKAISCHYANGSRCFYIDVKGTHQEEVEKTTMTLMKKRFNKIGNAQNINSYVDYFKFQSRPVNEKRANL
ncbi:hypothetical protein M3Y97_00768900 [Aphelenchoides bicaudatus]|nr:hypothetical protein M3Y97_00768900 [Aphelenchoides bicaudatus]